jgi:glycosyltransferase involved in cell wall biosynthesis
VSLASRPNLAPSEPESVEGELVSVVMPAFDEEAFVAEAVESVLAQTYDRFELIVVDDGSADRTGSIVSGFPGVRVVRRGQRGGPAAARNAGLGVARGDYWAIFDADDVMPPERLECQVEFLREHASVEMVLGLTEAFVNPGEPRPAHWNPAWDGGPYHGHPGTILARRAVLDRVGWFDESLELGSDMQWMARAKLAGVRMGQLEHPCLRYRIHAGNITSDVDTNRAAMLRALRTSRRLGAGAGHHG